jgi:hypothetical protein
MESPAANLGDRPRTPMHDGCIAPTCSAGTGRTTAGVVWRRVLTGGGRPWWAAL